jgi:hypothetical protein
MSNSSLPSVSVLIKECLSLLNKLIKIDKSYFKHCSENVKSPLVMNSLILKGLKNDLFERGFIDEPALFKVYFGQSLSKYFDCVNLHFVNNIDCKKQFTETDSVDLNKCYDSVCVAKVVCCKKVFGLLRSIVEQLDESNKKLSDNLQAHYSEDKTKDVINRVFPLRKYQEFLRLFTEHKCFLYVLKWTIEEKLAKPLALKNVKDSTLYLKLVENDFLTHVMIKESRINGVSKKIAFFFKEYENLDFLLIEFTLRVDNLLLSNSELDAVDKKSISDFFRLLVSLKVNIQRLKSFEKTSNEIDLVSS